MQSLVIMHWVNGNRPHHHARWHPAAIRVKGERTLGGSPIRVVIGGVSGLTL
jgi:hypothetical protein